MTPTETQSEQLTVEQCLAELREIAPKLTAGRLAIIAQGYDVVVGGRIFHGDTLSEAMAQVRQWYKEQQS